MALKDLTYNDLTNAIADWMARDDLTVAQLRDFVYLFETECNRRLSERQMETSTLLTTSSGVAALPADYLSWRGLTWNGSPTQEIEYVHPTMFRGMFSTVDQGVPIWFTVEGTNVNIRPVYDTADGYTLRYCQKVPNLSDSNLTNWFLLAHPDLYLNGCLVYGYSFVRDGDAASMAKNWMEQGFQQLYELNERSKAPAELRIVGTVV